MNKRVLSASGLLLIAGGVGIGSMLGSHEQSSSLLKEVKTPRQTAKVFGAQATTASLLPTHLMSSSEIAKPLFKKDPLPDASLEARDEKPLPPLLSKALSARPANSKKVSNGLETYTLSQQDAQALADSLKGHSKLNIAGGDTIEIVRPSDPNEQIVPLGQLNYNCPALNQLPGAAHIRVSGTGDVLEIEPLIPNSEVPSAAYSCQFNGGPAANYTTMYIPQAPASNRNIANLSP